MTGRKLSGVRRSLTVASVLFALSSLLVCQTPYNGSDCSTLKYLRHKSSCLCGTVQVCSGDLCGRPGDYGLDNDITVELRNKNGATVIESKKAVDETRAEEGTTQDGTTVLSKTTERKFCFDGKGDGKYQLAFILYRGGVPQPAVIFPTNYSRRRRKACNPIYMVEPICPK